MLQGASNVGAKWTHEVRADSLFGAQVAWRLNHEVKKHEGTNVHIAFTADATFQQTERMDAYLDKPELSMSGVLVIDQATGELVSSRATQAGEFAAKPQPDDDFEGGTLKMKRVVERTRMLSP